MQLRRSIRQFWHGRRTGRPAGCRSGGW